MTSAIALLGFIENGMSLAVFGAVALSLFMSVAFLLTRGGGGSAYDRIGAGGILREGDYDSPVPHPESPAARAEREREIRQMLRARSERLVRDGQPPLDVDAELARLLAGESGERSGRAGGRASDAHDPELLEEVRQLVLARNERRVRQGQQPLDMDAEVARTLAELDR